MCLLRYDTSYRSAFGINGPSPGEEKPDRGPVLAGDGFPNVRDYIRDV